MAMEGNEALNNTSSSEVRQHHSPSHKSAPLPDHDEKTTHLKFLLSNAEAGSVIGKGGSTINDIQSQSRARIQLSRNFEYFPGTSDRIIMVSGTFNDVLKAIDLILAKLLDEFHVVDGGEVDPESKVRLVVPNSSCGGLIGKGGSIIRSLIEDSRAGIRISPQDSYLQGFHDRLVTVTGTLDVQMRAIELILLKLVDDSYYSQSMSSPFSYAATHNGTDYRSNGGGVKFHTNRFPNKGDPLPQEDGNSITIGVADEHIGIVLGRGGRNIMEISQVSGARVKISDRGDFIIGTSDRKVTITGSERAVRAAETMILQKVASISES